jgi:hypothetical protein
VRLRAGDGSDYHYGFRADRAGTFKFKAPIGPQYPDNPTGEAARMEMLQGG